MVPRSTLTLVNPPRVLVFGEVLWDQFPDGAVLGGAPANFAIRVQTLGESVAFVSSVGQDELGDKTLKMLQDMGLDTRCIQRDAGHPTGIVQVHFEAHDAASAYTIVPNVAYDYVNDTPAVQHAASQVELVYFGTLAQRTAHNRQTLQKIFKAAPQAKRLLDINLRQNCYTPQTILDSLRQAHILKLNDAELIQISQILGWSENIGIQAFCERICQTTQVELCLVTLGAKGVYAFEKQKVGYQEFNVPGYQVKVVDTVGAGDAFTAGFVWSYLRGQGIAQSCEMGSRLGAMVAMQRGGTVPIRVEELLAFGEKLAAGNLVL